MLKIISKINFLFCFLLFMGCSDISDYASGKVWRWWIVYEDDREIRIKNPEEIEFSQDCASRVYICLSASNYKEIENYNKFHSPYRGYLHKRKVWFEDKGRWGDEQVFFTFCPKKKTAGELNADYSIDDNITEMKAKLPSMVKTAVSSPIEP